VDALQAKQDEATQALESYLEEGSSSGSGSSEDGLLLEALNDKDKITKASVAARTKLATDADEVKALKQATKLFNAETAAKKAVKGAQEALDLAVFNQYPKLDIDEIKTIIVDDKWLAILQANIVAEIERVTQQMANRVKELEERYSAPLPMLTESVDELSDKVADHLKAMGLEW
jgi:type I restriction enzyme M protein